MDLVSKLKTFKRAELASMAFYAITGVILLALLPLTGFPPHLGLIAILSLITAYSFFTKRFWAIWLVAILFGVATTFSLYTLYSIGFTIPIISTALIVYAVLTGLFTAYIVLKRRPLET